MKILHLITSLSTGGAETHLLTLCRQLRKLGHHQISVCYLRDNVKGSESLRARFELSGIDTWPLQTILSLILLPPPILHTHLPKADLCGWTVKRLHPKVKWVVTVHGKYAAWRGGRVGRWLWRIALQRADAIIAISKDLKVWLVRQGVPEEKVTVVYYGIEVDRYMPKGPHKKC